MLEKLYSDCSRAPKTISRDGQYNSLIIGLQFTGYQKKPVICSKGYK